MIAIIDDDKPTLVLLEKTLQKKGYEVKAFSVPELFLTSLAENEYNLLILDYMLPQMNGLEVLTRLENMGNDIPVIVITAGGSKEIIDEFFTHKNVVDFAVKPFESDFHCKVCQFFSKQEKMILINEINRLKVANV